jgi:beta-N-acetylhexosaminidase
VSPAITSQLLRGELGFTGAVVTDALEMRAVSATMGMVTGFVRALAAGADTVETGALDYPEMVEQLPAAVSRAVADGTLTLDRLRDAATRTRLLTSCGRTLETERDHTGWEDELFARCIEVVGALPALHAPLVIECRTPGGMASGELPWSLGEPLGELLPGAETARTTEPIALPDGRDVVLVVRDPHRVTWQQPMLAAAAARPGTVVVDCGWPAELAGAPLVRTRGIAPGLLRAAARLLAGGGP